MVSPKTYCGIGAAQSCSWRLSCSVARYAAFCTVSVRLHVCVNPFQDLGTV